VKASVKPFTQSLQAEAALMLNDYAVRALTPYTGRYAGRAVNQDSTLDVSIAYRIENNKLHADHKVLAQKFKFAEKIPSKDALHLPFGLAVALLKDTKGNIDVSLPVKGDISDPKFEYWHILGQVAVNFFMKIVTSPFTVLGGLVPAKGAGTKELNTVSFAPGDSVISPSQKEQLMRLVAAMKERPQLSLRINGSYDPEVDWNSLKAKVLEMELAEKRAKKTVSENSFYGDKYKTVFGSDNYKALKLRFAKGKGSDDPGLIAEMKRLIISKMPVNNHDLKELARARAAAVQQSLAAQGFDVSRAKIGSVRTELAIMQEIPTELELTVVQ
ncbi:MAG: DUF748 domain-containing protein, partial [Endomicrobiales bacterium]